MVLCTTHNIRSTNNMGDNMGIEQAEAVYKAAIDNMKAYIRSDANRKLVDNNQGGLSAFAAGDVLAIAFGKTTGEVVADLIRD
jgi:hypothetical protein